MPRDFVGDPDLGLFRREAHLRELVEPVLRRRVEGVDGLGEPDVVQGFTNAIARAQKWILSHSDREVAEAIAASTRVQLERLEALAMSLASSPEMMMLVSGMKNMATPIPCTTCGQRTKAKSTSGENRVRR